MYQVPGDHLPGQGHAALGVRGPLLPHPRCRDQGAAYRGHARTQVRYDIMCADC